MRPVLNFVPLFASLVSLSLSSLVTVSCLLSLSLSSPELTDFHSFNCLLFSLFSINRLTRTQPLFFFFYNQVISIFYFQYVHFLLRTCPNTEIILVSFNFTPEEIARYQAFLQYQQSAGTSEATPSTSQSTTLAISNPTPSSHAASSSHSQVPILSSNSIPSLSLSFHTSQQPSSQTAYSHSHPFTSQSQQISSAPPITQLYQNTRAQNHGHPAASSSSAPSFHPFFGTGLNISTSHVNQT